MLNAKETLGLKDFHQNRRRHVAAWLLPAWVRSSGVSTASAPRLNRAAVSDVYSRHPSQARLPPRLTPRKLPLLLPPMPLSRLHPAPLSTSVLFIWKSHSFHKGPWDWDAFPTHLCLADSHYWSYALSANESYLVQGSKYISFRGAESSGTFREHPELSMRRK